MPQVSSCWSWFTAAMRVDADRRLRDAQPQISRLEEQLKQFRTRELELRRFIEAARLELDAAEAKVRAAGTHIPGRARPPRRPKSSFKEPCPRGAATPSLRRKLEQRRLIPP
jgi:hypothetical protein